MQHKERYFNFIQHSMRCSRSYIIYEKQQNYFFVLIIDPQNMFFGMFFFLETHCMSCYQFIFEQRNSMTFKQKCAIDLHVDRSCNIRNIISLNKECNYNLFRSSYTLTIDIKINTQLCDVYVIHKHSTCC